MCNAKMRNIYYSFFFLFSRCKKKQDYIHKNPVRATLYSPQVSTSGTLTDNI